MRKISLYLLAASVYLIFNSSAWVNLTLVRPSAIVLPDHVRAIALVDRTLQEESPEHKLEQVFTGEFFRQDEQAVMQVKEGFIEACSGFNRFSAVRTEERYAGDGTKTTFPTPLGWDKVSEICNKYQADVVLSVEIFDTDFILTNNPVKVETTNDAGKITSRLEFRAQGIAVINFGIRLYDPSSQLILDEYQTTHRLNFEAQGGTLQAALNQLLNKVEAVNRASFDAGFIYGQRITPTYYRVTRYFFNKPKKTLGEGVRYSEVADWHGAIEAWMKVVNGRDRKDAGRAAYNIAVAWEVLGDLEKAREWAARSHTEFAEKEADDYYKLLTDRIREEQIVGQQVPQD
jgi:hypothetical protein